MIFVTVGTQLPFDRLIRAMDELAPLLGGERIFAQTKGGHYKPRNIEVMDYLCATEFMELATKARLIVSHAGTGTIISALVNKKPIVIMPRLAFRGEHRNEHQLATAMKMDELQYVHVAYDNKQLRDFILNDDMECLKELGETASDELVRSLTDFILDR